MNNKGIYMNNAEKCWKTSGGIGRQGKTSGSHGRQAEVVEEERKPWKRVEEARQSLESNGTLHHLIDRKPFFQTDKRQVFAYIKRCNTKLFSQTKIVNS